MLSLPKRLLDLPFVSVLGQNKDYLFLQKSLTETLIGRPSYLSMHAISMVVAGRQQMSSDTGYRIEVKAGEMVVMRKGIYTITDLVSEQDQFEAYLFFFREPLPSSLPGPPSQLPDRPFFVQQIPTSMQPFQAKMNGWASNKGSQDGLDIDQEALALLRLVQAPQADGAAFVGSLSRSPDRPLKALVETHFDKPLTIADFAYLTGKSESTFRRRFKAEFGITPRKWLRQQRMQKASQLLQEQAYSVTDAALAVGYEHISHFIEAFRETYGKTPKQWVKGL